MSTPAPAATPASKRKTRKPPATEAAPAPPPPDPAAPCRQSIPSLLGLHGLDPLEPVILAALLTEDPLLLIGTHGTGKSMLLERLAAALKLEFRHYNASLICFDDLIGFPVPEMESSSLKYLQTPATIWDAEAVFFDEVSRCKPDVQNKLFSILHERKVQGLPLERLRYRWSAMNPPVSSGGLVNYSGSMPLDTALADRYAFIVQMPDWKEMPGKAQEAILAGEGEPSGSEAGGRLRDLLERAKPLWHSLSGQIAPLLVEYLRALAALLQQADIHVSIRRLVMLKRNIAAVHAVRTLALGGKANVQESAWLAVSCSLPQAAESAALPEAKLHAAHREAWKGAADGKCRELIRILSEQNLVLRLVMAVRSDGIDLQERSIIVADCLTNLPTGARLRMVMWLMENDLAGRLVAAVAENVASEYSGLVNAPRHHSYSTTRSSMADHAGEEIRPWLSRLAPDDREGAALASYLVDRAARNAYQAKSESTKIIECWESTSEMLRQLQVVSKKT